MTAKARAGNVKDSVLTLLRGTSVGRDLATQAEMERQRLNERRTARVKFDKADAARDELPVLAEAVEKAVAKYQGEMERLGGELAEARQAHDSVAQLSSIHRSRAENVLRQTSAPLVHEHGTVVRALDGAIEHLRTTHCIGVESERVRSVAAQKPRTSAREDREPLEKAQRMVDDENRALELIDALEIARDELRDLQLEVEQDPDTVRESIEACPAKCHCGHAFGLVAAFEKAVEAEGVIA